MNIAVVTLAVPPFSYRSIWWWALNEADAELPSSVDIVGPSDEHQFQRKQLSHGTAHLLNIFAQDGEDWTERERNEFAVKSHVYLSKLQRSGSFDRILVADCAGAEPLLVGLLSTLGSVWVKSPGDFSSKRGELGYGLMDVADEVFSMDYREDPWPPEAEDVNRLFQPFFERRPAG